MTYLNIYVNLFLLVTIDHSSILDDQPVLGTLQVDGDLLDRGHHLVSDCDTLGGSLVTAVHWSLGLGHTGRTLLHYTGHW